MVSSGRGADLRRLHGDEGGEALPPTCKEPARGKQQRGRWQNREPVGRTVREGVDERTTQRTQVKKIEISGGKTEDSGEKTEDSGEKQRIQMKNRGFR